ncbi:hypothetical protein Xkoz_01474 [Xenorhabdus kozodoii]|uniref:Uncharacterized protein n=1 Tax=Xenorhabdus kozodoii TaxID=351676 RepID=A0A2D0L4U6_9GAMM|nr:hypothetical protein Xkoz_03027 [Xenorhabdus kozodoii]PHM73953.1 hypothetical protein Xkoz_01474 [Xenorhabdus kozodoii]
MLFDQHRVSTVKPGIKPGESKIKSMLKGNNINFNKCVDTYARVAGRYKHSRWFANGNLKLDWYIPVVFQVAALLAALIHPSHRVIYAPGGSFPCRRAAS